MEFRVLTCGDWIDFRGGRKPDGDPNLETGESVKRSFTRKPLALLLALMTKDPRFL